MSEKKVVSKKVEVSPMDNASQVEQAPRVTPFEHARKSEEILRKMKEEEEERIKQHRFKMVKGQFRNLEKPGMEHSFCYREFKNIPTEKYTFKDGGIYEVPFYIAEHLNNNCTQATFSQESERAGRNALVVETKISRFSFSNIAFN